MGKDKLGKVWIIYDGRAWNDPDEASVYEAFSEEQGETEEDALNTRNNSWPDGVVYAYDSDTDTAELKNRRLIG